MKNLFYILTMIFLLPVSSVVGQLIPYGLRLDKVQNEIIDKTTDLDSLVFFDKASFWNEDNKMNGLTNKLFSNQVT